MLVVTTRREPETASLGYFNDQVLAKRRLLLRDKLSYTHTKVGVRVQPHQRLVLIVFPTQMLKYLRFVWDCDVSGSHEQSTS